MQTAAENVERAIRDDGTPAPALLEEFDAVLRRMAEAIRSALAATAPAPPPVSRVADPEAVSAALTRLRELVDSNDGGAADEFAAVENVLAAAVDAQALNELRDALGDFEFDKAAAKLNEVIGAYSALKP